MLTHVSRRLPGGPFPRRARFRQHRTIPDTTHDALPQAFECAAARRFPTQMAGDVQQMTAAGQRTHQWFLPSLQS